MLKRTLPLLALLTALFWSRAAAASHFRYGTISWAVPDAQTAPLAVKFTVTTAWRAVQIGNTNLDFGDGTAANGAVTGTTIGTGTDAAGNAYAVTSYSVVHTYAAAGSYTAFFQSSARIITLENGASASYRVETKVSLAPGNTSGPVSAAPATIQMATGGVRTYAFPAYDPDDDTVTCRFATSAEMWSSNTAVDGFPPAASQNIPTESVGNKSPVLSNGPSGCVVTWDLTQGVPGKLYLLHLVLESTHGGQVSSTSIDLLVETVSAPPPSCAGSGTFVADIGQVFTTSTTATTQAGGTLLLNATNAPSGSVINPASGLSGPSPYSNSFTWTPTASFAGTTQIVTMSYTDTANNLSGACFLTIQIPQCAGFGAACSVGVGECQQSGTNICTGPGVTMCTAVSGQPGTEICDGKDNDCDGATDEGNPGGGVACATGLPGVCSTGTTACTGGAVGCDPTIPPATQMETCDGKDNNCDGATDEGNPGGGVACATGLPGVCAAGTTACAAGALACNATITPGSQVEACDSQDNNCDGTVDEGFNLGMMCSNGVGECTKTGTITCNGMGTSSCNAVPGAPSAEICTDVLDNDCDGTVNNGCPDPDSDSDGLTDIQEAQIGTDPNDADSDDDGVLDGQEPSPSEDTDGDGKINALDPDSDDDGLFDGTELGKDCSNAATDATKMQCIADADKGATKTNPLDADTDKGSVKDGVEDANHNGQVDADERDPNNAADDVKAPECTADGDCGAVSSGKVCDEDSKTCIDGCRGKGGNGCPKGRECTSQTAAIGTCTDGSGGAGGGGGGGGAGGSGESDSVSGNFYTCSSAPAVPGRLPVEWLFLSGGIAAVAARRRSSRRVAQRNEISFRR